jgi:hypothetical protein
MTASAKVDRCSRWVALTLKSGAERPGKDVARRNPTGDHGVYCKVRERCLGRQLAPAFRLVFALHGGYRESIKRVTVSR